MSNNLRFINLSARAYKGIDKTKKAEVDYPSGFELSEEKLKNIDPNNGIVIFFPEGYNYVQFEADQGKGKTSLAEALREVCGADSSPRTINTTDNDRNVKSRFVGKDGKLYDVSITRSGVTLMEIVTDDQGEIQVDSKGKEQRREVKSPKTVLQTLVGPAGVDPVWLQEIDGKKQVEWLRSLYSLDQDVIKAETQIKVKFDNAFKERTRAGQEKNRLEAALSANKYYREYESWDKHFREKAKQYDEKKVQQEIAAIQERHTEYLNAENGLANLKQQKAQHQVTLSTLEARVKELEEQLMRAKQAVSVTNGIIKDVDARIKKGEEYLVDNASIKDQYNDLSKKMNEVTTFKLEKQQFDAMVHDKKSLDHWSDEYIRLTNMVDAQREAKRKFIAMFSPQVPGLEVCLPDEEERREGLFYNGKPLELLAESELWEMCAALWKELNIKIIIVENINRLGSGAVAMFNEFVKQGGWVFATMMNRQQQALKITFNTQIT